MSDQRVVRITWKSSAIIAGVMLLAYCGTRDVDQSDQEMTVESVAPVGHPAAIAEVHQSDANLKRGAVGAISARCVTCHQEEAEKWKNSHHGLANRLVSKERDGEAFAAAGIDVPGENWMLKWADGERPTADVTFTNGGETRSFPFDMAIGETPLIQYLTQSENGRWQTSRTAWAPLTHEWIDTMPGDDRANGEWGHWLGRGMNWNANCAYCHMTNYHKGYDVATDTYHSTWDEMSIGCTQCHGDLAATPQPESGCLIEAAGDPMLHDEKVVMDACASCHSRRAEFDDNFRAGAKFGDHYHLTLPTHPAMYYADGQILNEDYVWTSLNMSKMGHAGVGCLDCHDPHTAAIKFPIDNNALCLQCHGGGLDGATIINPTQHSFHEDGSTGNLCVECHMPETVYMGNDPRRDHGFHTPDPLLTRELGIPNACNKCHEEESTDWAVEWMDKWYGEKMNRPERDRTRSVQLAYDGDPSAIDGLLAAFDREEIPLWQASLIELMSPWARDPRVLERVAKAMESDHYLVRVACAGLLRDAGDIDAARKLIDDPVRAVRMEAAWGLTDRLPDDSDMMNELNAYLDHVADQPAGALRRGQMMVTRGNFSDAAKWFKQVVEWDPSSAASHREYAVYLSRIGKSRQALQELGKAAALEPENPYIHYLQGLGFAELKQHKESVAAFRVAVALDPQYLRAYYNLALVLIESGELNEALVVAATAGELAPNDPVFPWMRARVFRKQNKANDAINEAKRALKLNPRYEPAIQILREFGVNP